MSRPCQLPLGGVRRTITLRPDLDEILAVMAAKRRVPISLIVEELVEHGLQPPITPELIAIDFPPRWDGSDLRERLYWLRMTQHELAKALQKPQATVNEWVVGNHPVPREILSTIQELLKSHTPGPIRDFRTRLRSPDSRQG